MIYLILFDYGQLDKFEVYPKKVMLLFEATNYKECKKKLFKYDGIGQDYSSIFEFSAKDKIKEQYGLTEYTIKDLEQRRKVPLEPKPTPIFKIGDIVRDILTDEVFLIRTQNNLIKINRLGDIELWEPKENELCYFWDDENSAPVLDFFKEKNEYYFESKLDGNFNFCSPKAILPKYMEDKLNEVTK